MHDDCGRENIGIRFSVGADEMVKRLKHPRFDRRVWRQKFISARMPLYSFIALRMERSINISSEQLASVKRREDLRFFEIVVC